MLALIRLIGHYADAGRPMPRSGSSEKRERERAVIRRFVFVRETSTLMHRGQLSKYAYIVLLRGDYKCTCYSI